VVPSRLAFVLPLKRRFYDRIILERAMPSFQPETATVTVHQLIAEEVLSVRSRQHLSTAWADPSREEVSPMSPDKVLPMSPDAFVTHVPGRYSNPSAVVSFMGCPLSCSLQDSYPYKIFNFMAS